MTVIIVGANGMLGFALHRVLSDKGIDTLGTVRGPVPTHPWSSGLRYAAGIDIAKSDGLLDLVRATGARTVINAAGVIKQVPGVADLDLLYRINSVFPRRLQMQLAELGVRLIHFSTDCVFSGLQGNYSEADIPDAGDAYGQSKFLGEPDGANSLVLRTSIIGMGMQPNGSLVDWFLGQTGSTKGYSKAVFSGFPVNAVGQFISDHILDQHDLSGLWHYSASAIDKFSLLKLVQGAWKRHDINIEADPSVIIDRSLDSSRLRSRIGWEPASWPDMIENMHAFYARLGERQSAS